MGIAQWILTFDDGPLPADWTAIDGRSDDEMLAPLADILAALEHSAFTRSIPAVFFLRGPAFPWNPSPPDALDPLIQKGVQLIERAGRHYLALHCFRHDPQLWHGWPFTADLIRADLDSCAKYFAGMTTQLLTAFRPPYGDGGLSSPAWAVEHRRRFHRWDIDTEDWLHHPDAGLLRRFEREADAENHLQHMLAGLPAKMWFHAFWPGANDFLLHVSHRTAIHLPRIIARICEVTRQLGHEPDFVVPPEYLTP